MPRTVKKREIDLTKLTFSITEMCLILGLSRPTIEKMIRQGILKTVKAGEKRYLVPNWALHEFLNSPRQERGN